MAINPGDVIQATVLGTCFGQRIRHVRTWYVDTVSAPIVSDINFVSDMLLDTKLGAPHDKVTPYITCLSSSWAGLTYSVQKVSPYRFARREVAITPGTVGSRGAATSANIQGAITCTSSLAGRKYTASYKIGPVAVDDSVAGKLVLAMRTALENYCGDLVLPLGIVVGGATAVLQPAIFHAGTRTPFVPASADIILAARSHEETRVKVTRTIGRGE